MIRTQVFKIKVIDANSYVRPLLLKQYRHFSSTQSSGQNLDLGGIYPPIPTPFKQNEDLSWNRLKDNLSKWENVSFKGYVVQGSNGEYVSMSHEERLKMVEFVRKTVAPEKLIIAGSGCEGTRETVLLTNRMAEVGADAALVTTPSFFKNRMNYDAMMEHYTRIAESSTIPVILYNVPSNTGVEFPLKAICELAKHPNVIGLKDSGGNITNIADVIHETSSENFQVIAGSASFLLASMQLGAVGGICALANILGDECCRLYSLLRDDKIEEARKLQLSLIKPNQAVTRKYNVPGMKYAMSLFGFYGGPCRSPLTPLKEAEAEDVKQSFTAFL